MRRYAFFVFFLFFLALPAHAGTIRDRQQMLEPLFDGPCEKYQVPKQLALAIARQESGCHPWIVNISGKDYRPKTKEEAMLYASYALRTGRSFDVGIMQVNSYWIKKHGWALDQVLDPQNNVKIGIWILAQEIRRHGLNWKAVASYHTPIHRNPTRGKNYARCIVAHLRNILEGR